MDAIREGYVTTEEAAALIGKGINMISKLCQSGKLSGAEKLGNSWLIPRASVESYSPGKRGPRTKKERLSSELDGIRADIRKSKEV
ncbi:MAG: helix-turn-helix domain-containing protein [Synergistaceae bacterium]|nr:helix-turn-helix domain-containing protein [Synergistaceae bacterium]